MYVCICNALCDKTISAAISSGGSDADSVYAACGVRPNCRSCATTIEAMIERHYDTGKSRAREGEEYFVLGAAAPA